MFLFIVIEQLLGKVLALQKGTKALQTDKYTDQLTYRRLLKKKKKLFLAF